MSQFDEERICAVVVRWMNTFGVSSSPIKSLEELSDGVVFFQILAQLSPKHFDLGSIASAPRSGFAKISNMKQLKAALERFYLDVLTDDLFFKDAIEPAALAFGRQPKDFVSLMEVFLLAAIKSENREDAITKMLKLDIEDQTFLVQLLDVLTRQNGFVEQNGDVVIDNSPMTPIVARNASSSNNNNNNNNNNKLNDSQYALLQFSARKYDKTRRMSMQSPMLPRYSSRSGLNSNGQNVDQNNETFDFRQFENTGNGSGSSNSNQLLMSPPLNRNSSKISNETMGLYSSNQFMLDANKTEIIRQLELESRNLQNDLSKCQSEYKMLATENGRIKDEYKFLEDRVRNNIAQEFQRKEKEYLSKMALLEEQSNAFCKDVKSYEATVRSLRNDNDKLTKELTQLGSMHESQLRQYREELGRLKTQDLQYKKYQQEVELSSAQLKELENVKFRNDQLFNENIELKCQVKQIPQLKEQVEQYKQQLLDYKIRGVGGNNQRTNEVLQDVLDDLHSQKRICAQTQGKYQDTLKELTDLKEKLKHPSFRGMECKKCDELQKQVEVLTQYSTEQKKKLKDYQSALEILRSQKININDCELHKSWIESLRSQIQELQDEKKLFQESFQRERLGVSNAFYALALDKTVQGGNMHGSLDNKTGLVYKSLDLNANRGARNSFDMMNSVSRKGKENVPQFYTTDDLKTRGYEWKNIDFGNNGSNSASNLNLNTFRSTLSNTYGTNNISNQNKMQQDVTRSRLQQTKNYFDNN